MLDVFEEFGDDVLGVDTRWIETCLRCEGVRHPALADEPGGRLWDPESDYDGEKRERPLRSKRNRVSFVAIQTPENDQGSGELAQQSKSWEESHARASENRRQDLRHVCLARSHDCTDCAALEELAYQKGDASSCDVRWEIRTVHDGNTDGREEGRNTESVTTSDLVLQPSSEQRADHGANGRSYVPQRKPGGG